MELKIPVKSVATEFSRTTGIVITSDDRGINVQVKDCLFAVGRKRPFLGRDRTEAATDIEDDVGLPQDLMPIRESPVAADDAQGVLLGFGEATFSADRCRKWTQVF